MTIILVPYLGSIFRTTDAPVFDAGLQWITRHGAKEIHAGFCVIQWEIHCTMVVIVTILLEIHCNVIKGDNDSNCLQIVRNSLQCY